MLRKVFVMVWMICLILFVYGCGLRFAANEDQKKNAYLHKRVAEFTKSAAANENVSPELTGLTELNELQSRAFVADYGLPKNLPASATIDDVLNESSYTLADKAMASSAEKPDAWSLADGILDIGIAVTGLLGGVWGVKIASILRSAKVNTNALREIIIGNEIFKTSNEQMSEAFKEAHVGQSIPTRKIVTEIRKNKSQMV